MGIVVLRHIEVRRLSVITAFLFVRESCCTLKNGFYGTRPFTSKIRTKENQWKKRLEEEGIVDAAESVKWISDYVMKSNICDPLQQFDCLCQKRLKR